MLLLAIVGLLLVGSSWAHEEDDFGMDDYGGMDGMDGMDDYGGMGEDYDDDGGGRGGGGDGTSAMGAVKLDNYTFNKLVGIPGLTTLVKFDKEYPYGDQEDEFKELCKLAYGVPNFLIGEVQVSDYGDYANDDLREKYSLKSEDFPAYILFNGLEKQVKYPGTVTAADLASWLRRQGLKKMPSVGTIAEFDEIAAKFHSGKDVDAYIAEAQKLLDADFKEDPKAAVYLKIMNSIKNKGIGYISKEIARMDKVMAGDISEEKRTEFAMKARILSQFSPPAKDEL